MTKRISINILAISLIGVLLVPITGSAHRAGGQNPPDQVHRVIEVLYRLDSADVHDEVAHDFNNYGNRPHNNPALRDGYEGGHAGYDVAHVDDDAPFYSLTDGEVIKVVRPNPYNIKKLSHIAIYNATHRKTVLYLHPSAIDVEEGNTVKVGTPLGRQGNTGNSTNPHVHLEVRRNRSEVASWGITASKRTDRPNEDPIPFLYDQAKDFQTPRPGGVPIDDRPRNNRPDLVIESIETKPATLVPGIEFKLYATLKNQGNAVSEATRLRYYRSTNDRISPSDNQLGSGHRNPLAPDATIRRYLPLTVPTTPGTYYYGVCVDAVDNESDTSNNCSEAIEVIVRPGDVNTNAADVNGDGVVDIDDLVWVAEEYGQKGNNVADVNGDRVVDINDLIFVAEAIDDAAGAPAIQSQMQALFTVEQLQGLLTEAKALEKISPHHQRGIDFLKQLFRLSTPKKTSLLPNYPNPFNPETWIPYHLAKRENVVINIYNSQGILVRVLPLGHQPAGYYTHRSQAAYWDGRNTLGEPVASGIYFYQLETDTISTMRKMVILK